MLALQLRHDARKRIAQSRHYLEHRKIDVGQGLPDQMVVTVRVAPENTFKVTQKFRQAVFTESRRAAPCFRLLLFVIECARNRMVSIMSMSDEIGEGQLKLMRP